MSEEMFKAGIRWELKFLKGKQIPEIIKFFEIFDLEPDDVDEEDGYIDYPEKINAFHPREENGDWYLEYIVVREIAYNYTPFCVSMNKILYTTDKLEKELVNYGISDVKLNHVVFAYTWYNGVDEPFVKGE